MRWKSGHANASQFVHHGPDSHTHPSTTDHLCSSLHDHHRAHNDHHGATHPGTGTTTGSGAPTASASAGRLLRELCRGEARG